MVDEFAGKVAIVTGATGNLGSAVARRFAAGGAKLVLVDRSMERLEIFCEELAGVETMPATTDVTDADQIDALVRQTEERFGQIDILAHTVGGFLFGKPVADLAVDELDRMYNLNTRPVYLVAGRVARSMLDRSVKGHITVVIARSALRGSGKLSAYTASKAAALRIVESLALEVRDQGIHVNAVSPSTLDTPQNRADMPSADASKWVTPEQVAEAIAFLSGEASAAFYGANLEVYGRA